MKQRIDESSVMADEIEGLFAGVPPTEAELEGFHRAIAELECDASFIADFAKAQFVEDIYEAMEAAGLNKKGLAERLGKSRQWVTRVLNERANFTIETMAVMCAALGMKLSVRLHHTEHRVAILPRLTRPRELAVFGVNREQKAWDTTRMLEQVVPDERNISMKDEADGKDNAA